MMLNCSDLIQAEKVEAVLTNLDVQKSYLMLNGIFTDAKIRTEHLEKE